MSQDVITRCNRRWDGDCPGIIRLSQLVRTPEACCSWTGRFAQQTNGVDFVEFEGCFVDCVALAVAVGEIVENGAVVRYRPLRPFLYRRIYQHHSPCKQSCQDLVPNIISSQSEV